MIKNDRQYRITRAQAEKFEKALARVSADGDRRLHPAIRKAQHEAVASQLQDLRRDIDEYEALKKGLVTRFHIESLSDLPRALIQARIASGLTQKELAERLGLKEQQIQRYEATDYASASISKLQQVAAALDVSFAQDLVLEDSAVTANDLLDELKSVGLDQRFVFSRLLPRSLGARFQRTVSTEPSESDLAHAASILNRIFRWSDAHLFGREALRLDPAVAGQARFKMAARAHEGKMALYTTYAHFLASVVAEAAEQIPRERVPTEWKEVRNSILDRYGEISFASGLCYAWDLGVPVLPLTDSGVFDAACWRIEGRNVVVLKQGMRSQARWLFDLLHELHHVGDDPDSKELAVIEFEDSLLERRSLPEEDEAHQFAGDVMLDGRAEELTQICVNEAQGRVEYLKIATQKVAMAEDVAVDALANYLAFRLSLQGINWWGTATNLQSSGPDPFGVARDELLKRVSLSKLDDVERELLSQALRGYEDSR